MMGVVYVPGAVQERLESMICHTPDNRATIGAISQHVCNSLYTLKTSSDCVILYWYSIEQRTYYVTSNLTSQILLRKLRRKSLACEPIQGTLNIPHNYYTDFIQELFSLLSGPPIAKRLVIGYVLRDYTLVI